jgi:dTDP-4-amino-4,6-dideoxygalactose transaminase
MPILLPKETKREDFMGCMKEQGIQTSFHYPPVHTFTAYKHDTQLNLPITEEVASREVTLPLFPAMRMEDVDTVARAVLASL